MRAIILSAGLGTRLRPLTYVRPKVLVPVMGTTMLDYWVWQLYEAGFDSAVVNAFHLKEKLLATAEDRAWPIPVEIRSEPLLLGTGGGLRNVLDFFQGEPFAVINGDTVCKVPLRELFHRHMRSGSPATLLMHDHPAFNNVAVSGEGEVLAFGREALALAGQRPEVALRAFTGIHFIQPDILEHLARGVPEEILTVYRKLIADGTPPLAEYHPDLFWREMGTLQSYTDLNCELARLPHGFLHPFVTGEGVWVHPESHLAPDVRLKGCVAVGRGCRIGANVEMEDVILWDGVEVEPNSALRHCIVADGVTVSGAHAHETLVGDSA